MTHNRRRITTSWIAALLGALAGAFWLGSALADADARQAATAGERVVAALPGVGAGWLDTLRRVAGNAAVDTITPMMAFDEAPGADLLGLFLPWFTAVYVNPHMPSYAAFQRSVCHARSSFDYVHPVNIGTPAGAAAHEFGHRFRFGLWPHGIEGWPGDSIPTYAQGGGEEFADRFARAMLALRGWDDPDPRDALLNHVVSIRLRLSYASPE